MSYLLKLKITVKRVALYKMLKKILGDSFCFLKYCQNYMMFPLVLYPLLFWGCVLPYLRSPKGSRCSISDDLSCCFNTPPSLYMSFMVFRVSRRRETVCYIASDDLYIMYLNPPWGPWGLSRECVLRIPSVIVKGD